jgi:uncharacterized protein (DUF58 family)
MTIRPGINLIRAGFGLALLSVVAAFWPPLAWLVAFGVLLVLAWAIYDRRQALIALDGISIVRTIPQVIGRDVAFDARLTATNSGTKPVWAEIRDEFPADAEPRLAIHRTELPAVDRVELVTTCRIPRRGRRTFGPIWVRIAGPLQLVEAQRSLASTSQVKVLPETFASRERLQKDLGAELKLLDQMQRSRQQGVGSEFESLYLFRDGDDPRRIDWRASARQQELVIRRFQVERHRDVMIVIDTGRLMGSQAGAGSKLDCAVDAALNLARVAILSGDRCGVAAFDRKVRGFLPPVSGSSALKALVECVFDLDTKWHESDFTPMLADLRSRRAKRTFVIVLSDVNDAETSQRLCAGLQQLSRSHLVLFAALRTPLLNQIVNEPVRSERDAAKKAVAFRLLRDRGRALHALRRGGIHVLDVEPHQLTLPLVNQFIELRQRNLL